MKKHLFGFTLIEVVIFLAVTGALFVAITVGVQNSIYQQRYNDTVQSYVDFLGNLYSEVINVQSFGDGRSGKAVYGKLVTFGESDSTAGKQVIHTYDVVAKAVNSWDDGVGNQATLNILKNPAMGANVLMGVVEDYTPRWSAKIEKTDSYEDYVGALLIVRGIKTGVVQTYVYKPVKEKKTIEVKQLMELGDDSVNVFIDGDDNLLKGFETETVDFCVNPNGNEATGARMDVRIVKNAHDASGIEVISFDNADSKCNNATNPE